MNDTLSTILVAVFLFGGLLLSIIKKRWEYTLLGIYLIFVLAIIETAGSLGWIILLEAIAAVAFYGLYILFKWLDNKVYEWRNKR